MFITIYIIIQYLKSRIQLVGEICFHMWDGIFTNKPENPIFKEIGLSLAKNLLELKLNPMSVASNLSYKCVTGKTIVSDLPCKAHKLPLN